MLRSLESFLFFFFHSHFFLFSFFFFFYLFFFYTFFFLFLFFFSFRQRTFLSSVVVDVSRHVVNVRGQVVVFILAVIPNDPGYLSAAGHRVFLLVDLGLVEGSWGLSPDLAEGAAMPVGSWGLSPGLDGGRAAS